ncbi:unnamed protein product [Penicillium nalgiovense]|nr:unnamed protein product [Penicillium nalgiovense]
MADAEIETKQRKSVAFSEGSVIMDTNGQVTDAPPAEKPTGEKDVDEVTEMFKGLSKKKKTSKKTKSADAGDDEEAPAADGEFDPSALKKKKKNSSKSKKADATDFDAKLAEAGIAEEAGEEQPEELPEGDLEAGTEPPPRPSGHRRQVLQDPPPQCLREGNRRTIFANIADICKRMKRSEEHCTQFLFAELGTSGSVDGSRRLVIKGRFQQKGIESVLRRYIVEYVTCKTCRSPDTELNKGENRLYFVTCNSCGSRRSVAAIKTGFRSQIGRRKRVG